MQFDSATQIVLLYDSGSGRFHERTDQVASLEEYGSRVRVRFKRSRRLYPYLAHNVSVVDCAEKTGIAEGSAVEVKGVLWSNATGLEHFRTPFGAWIRVRYVTVDGEGWRTFPSEHVRIVENAMRRPRVAQLMGYFGDVVASLEEGDPLRKSFEKLTFVHPDSALATYLEGQSIPAKSRPAQQIFPFSSNQSQREAVPTALENQIAVIDGPPGTGKTQTILNLIANVIRDPRASVGVVSFTNTAVENVYEKLVAEGLSFVAAPMGSREKRESFVAGQERRDDLLKSFLATERIERLESSQLHAISQQLDRYYALERWSAQLRAHIEALTVERHRFERSHEGRQAMVKLPRSSRRWNSTKVLALLAELELRAGRRSWSQRLWWSWRRRMTYRLSRREDEFSPAFGARLRSLYYEKRLAEHKASLASSEGELAAPPLAGVAVRATELSRTILEFALDRRYRVGARPRFSNDDLWKRLDEVGREYPVLLSTCHSLPNNLPSGKLLDYLIVDEASQVNLAIAVLAMSRAKRVIVVGDSKQLPHIPADIGGAAPPGELGAYDYVKHSALSSVEAVFGPELPRTMLREHYRCDPRIIEFCNRKFYGGRLIPMRAPGAGAALALVRTAPGEHARSHISGGRTNQREREVFAEEVAGEYLSGMQRDEYAVITPFRKQADLFAGEDVQATSDTVHAFQGREKRAVVLSTVVDWRVEGSLVSTFVDDPRLVNVAVSRAQDRLVMIANPRLPADCRNLLDLAEYIEQQNPDGVVQSDVVSVFDTLYSEYAVVLRSLARKMGRRTPFRSEEAVLVSLEELLTREQFQGLGVSFQVPLRDLVGRPEGLTDEESEFVRRRSSVDFVVWSRTTRRALGAVEVDGFSYHADDAQQLRRDALKDQILAKRGLPVLRLATTGSGEVDRLDAFVSSLA